jgi:hypothetical protein
VEVLFFVFPIEIGLVRFVVLVKAFFVKSVALFIKLGYLRIDRPAAYGAGFH